MKETGRALIGRCRQGPNPTPFDSLKTDDIASKIVTGNDAVGEQRCGQHNRTCKMLHGSDKGFFWFSSDLKITIHCSGVKRERISTKFALCCQTTMPLRCVGGPTVYQLFSKLYK
jgi:hypothetical protein